ncbi:MAG: sigma factor-like helix-turn-helix DNA-binding protein [Desulfotomaculaceae bacterium]
METHVRKFILAELERYKDSRKQLQELELDRAEIGRYPVATWKREAVSGGRVTDPTADQAARLERLNAVYARTRFYTKAIENVLNVLPSDRRLIIEMHCIDGLPVERVEEELYINRATVFRHLNEILPLFALRMGL